VQNALLPGAGVPSASNGAERPRVPASRAVRAVLLLIRAYKILISPLFTGACRFTPSCSEYMAEAVARYGVLRGAWFGVVRLSRCHPLGGHGFDPVPPPPIREARDDRAVLASRRGGASAETRAAESASGVWGT
jgi:putative membrane protein insertion efficiency factor